MPCRRETLPCVRGPGTCRGCRMLGPVSGIAVSRVTPTFRRIKNKVRCRLPGGVGGLGRLSCVGRVGLVAERMLRGGLGVTKVPSCVCGLAKRKGGSRYLYLRGVRSG